MKKRIYTDIVGDLFHIGHAKFLEKCKSFGDHLTVGVCSDADCAEDKRKPILSLEERVGMVKQMRCVDKVIANCPWHVTGDLIIENEIDLVIHAHPKEEHPYWEEIYVEAVIRNIFKRIDRREGISTTDILNRVKQRQ